MNPIDRVAVPTGAVKKVSQRRAQLVPLRGAGGDFVAARSLKDRDRTCEFIKGFWSELANERSEHGVAVDGGDLVVVDDQCAKPAISGKVTAFQE